MKHYLESTSNCLYGNGCESEEKVFFTRRQRKCKMAVMGLTTFITIASVVVDWYNFVYYTELTHKSLIFTEDAATDAIYWAFAALCIIGTLLMMGELVSFVLQLKATRIYDAPVTRSEFTEEVISGGLLFFQNMGLPLLFVVGLLMGMCSINAQIRSFSGRMALLVAAVSSLWRFVQSFAYCWVCRQDSKLPFCQALRAFWAFFVAVSLAIISFLLCVSFSMEISLNVNNYNGRYHGQRFSDSTEGVFLYQRIATPYSIVNKEDDGLTQSCSFLETKFEVAKSKDMENIHENIYMARFACSDISEFHELFIDDQHRPLISSYNCSIIVGMQNDDETSGRIVNAVYELRDSQSSSCISGPIDLVLDSRYNPENSYVVQASDVWSDKAVQGMVENVCVGRQGTCPELNQVNTPPVFNCTSPSCVTPAVSSDNGTFVALVSPLLVSERQLLSYYPCMPYVDLTHQLELNACESPIEQQDSSSMDESIVEYTSCVNTHLANDRFEDMWQEEEAEMLQKYN